MEEITFELTDYCPEHCKFCSSNGTNDKTKAHFLDYTEIELALAKFVDLERIHLSGGEPLAHPRFYEILQLCKRYVKDVIVHTNALSHIAINLSVLDNVYVEGYLTVAKEMKKIHVLKRIEQGKEATRPEVHLSKNFNESCDCHHHVLRSDGVWVKNPCRKYTETDIEQHTCQCAKKD